jgi:probable HAF family extracellular repeat protein
MKKFRMMLVLVVVGVFALTVVLPALVLAAPPEIYSMSPTSGSPGTPVTITGANFEPGAKAALGPALLGSCATSGYAMAVAVSGGYAYLAGSGLTVIDVRDPDNLQVVGSCATPDFGRGVVVKGGYAYVVGGDWTACNGFLRVIDVYDPASPYVVGSVDWSSGVGCDIALMGDYAYVADGYYSGLRVIGLGTFPSIVASLAVPGAAGSIALTRGYAYLSAGQSGLHVLDISSPTSPALLATCDTPGYARNVALAGSLVYVTDDWAGLQAIDVSNPAAPQIVGACATSYATYGIAVAGSYAYVTEDDYGLQVLDITNPAAPRIAISVPTAGTGSEFNPAVWGGKAYVARELSGLDIASPFQPLQGVSYIDPGTLNATVAASQGPGTWDLHVVNPDGGEHTLPAAFSVPPVYTITDLGTLGGEYSDASGINNLGQVVGRSPLAPESEEHAFLWTPVGGMQDLGTLGGTISQASAINNNGQVVGVSTADPADMDWRAFLWTAAGGMQELVVSPGELPSTASGINDNGQVAGAVHPSGYWHACLWTVGGGMQDLGTLPGYTYSFSNGINESGHVVGYCDVYPGDRNHAFLWTSEDGMQDLGTIVSEGASCAWAINDHDHVVGRCNNTPGSEGLGFLWRPNEVMVDLNDLIDDPSWVLWGATDINNSGQIVGYGLRNGFRHAFLLTPIPSNPPPDAPVIEKIGNRMCYPGERIRIIGTGFGDTQGDSVVHLNNLAYGPGHNRIRSWSDTMIRLKVPYNNKPCEWYTHGEGEYRRRSVWVTVDGVDSNKKVFKIMQPVTCQ